MTIRERLAATGQHIMADARQAKRLVSLRLSALSAGIVASALDNQGFLFGLIDRLNLGPLRYTIVGVFLFLAFFLPSLKCELVQPPAERQKEPEPDASAGQ